LESKQARIDLELRDKYGRWNTAAVLRFLYEDAGLQQDVFRKARKRVREALARESIKATPRSLDAVLWDVMHGERVELKLQAADIQAAIAVAVEA